MLDGQTVRLFTYGAAGALLTVDKDATATIRLRGPITGFVMRELCADTELYMQRRSLQAIVMDASGALCLCGPGGLSRDPALVPYLMRRVPIAAVVPPQNLEGMEEQVKIAAEAGLVRRVFTAYRPALEWAAAKGRALQPFPPEQPFFLETN